MAPEYIYLAAVGSANATVPQCGKVHYQADRQKVHCCLLLPLYLSQPQHHTILGRLQDGNEC